MPYRADLAAQLRLVLRLLVDAPDQVRVDPVEEEGQTLFAAHLASADVGKVIGRQGATIGALRTLLRVRSSREGRAYALQVAGD